MTLLFRKKNIIFPVSITLLIMFLFVSMKPGILIQGFHYNKNTTEEAESAENISNDSLGAENVCSLTTSSCCCDVRDHSSHDCCCKSKTLGNRLSSPPTSTDNNFLSAVISSIKCSNMPGNIAVSSLADYEPLSSNRFFYLLEESGRIHNQIKNDTAEPHLSLQFKPPRSTV